MPAELDPLSQLIGGLTAQVQSLGAGLIDLRSEIVTNRNVSQSRWDDLTEKIEKVWAEYRNVKHSERGMAQKEESLAAWMKVVEKRLGQIEKVILVWRTRLAMLLALGAAFGAALGIGADAALRHWAG